MWEGMMLYCITLFAYSFLDTKEECFGEGMGEKRIGQ
jgi:hypothetical protein